MSLVCWAGLIPLIDYFLYSQNVSIDETIPHPGYSPTRLRDDIALIRLSEPVDFSLG